MDAVGEAASLGINTDFARTYTADTWGTQSVYTAMNNVVSTIRSTDFNTKDINSASYKAVMDSLDEVK